METITSRTNPLMRRIRKLRDDRKARRNEGLYLCDGVKMLEEAVKWNADVRTVILSEDLADTPVPAGARAVLVPADLMRSISPMEAPQGALFLVNAPALTPPEQLTKDRYLILDALQDPGNVGTLCRPVESQGRPGHHGSHFSHSDLGDRCGGTARPAGALRPDAGRHRTAGRHRLPAGGRPLPQRCYHRQRGQGSLPRSAGAVRRHSAHSHGADL